jgi:hypothetical protein
VPQQMSGEKEETEINKHEMKRMQITCVGYSRKSNFQQKAKFLYSAGNLFLNYVTQF